MYVELNFPAIVTLEFVSLFIDRISQKIPNIFLKIISRQSVNRSKINRYSVFPAVNSGKQRITAVGMEFTAVGMEFTAVDESTPFG